MIKGVVLITGASSGFGQTTANYLANKGYIVYGTSRKVVADSNINMIKMDVCQPESITAGIKHILEKEGRIDVLINNAGMGIGGSIELATSEEISLQMNTNFMGMANMCKEVLPIFRKQRIRNSNVLKIVETLRTERKLRKNRLEKNMKKHEKP